MPVRVKILPVRAVGAAGFALPAVLVITGALLILAVGILLVSGIERRTARSYVELQRADLAARAALAEVKAVLDREAANDDFLILQSVLETPVTDGRESPPYLFIGRGEAAGGSGAGYRLKPLFSTADGAAAAAAALRAPEVEPLLGPADGANAEMATLPYQDLVRAAWVPLEDEDGRMVGRYAYWVEDLQSRLDPSATGNEEGEGNTHARAGYPFPAAGLNPEPLESGRPALDQVALYAIDPEAGVTGQGSLAGDLIGGRGLLVSPDSLLAAAGIEPPLTRDRDGRLTDPKARAAEENLVAVARPYHEQPLVPFAAGIDDSVAGLPKLNLNEILSRGPAGVDRMAGFISEALPNFESRKGGFPEDYLRTLAANAIDYADEDTSSTLVTGSHRGLDAYPLVSEFLMRFRWEGIRRENGRVFVLLRVNTYVELWNMTDQPVAGDAEVSYETKYEFPLGANPSISLHDLEDAEHDLTEREGFRWFPAFSVSLRPNEHRIYNCGAVRYKIDAGPESLFIPSPLTLGGEQFGASGAGYRLRWAGQIIDGSAGGVHRNDANLHFPASGSRLAVATRTTIPGHSYTRQGNWRNNMGDPRMAYYIQAPQDPNVYPGNYSPNRRTIRWDSIYRSDAATKPKVHGRVMPSEWPDGGHNSIYGSNAFATTNANIEPDDPRFFSGLPTPRREEAPVRLSKAGRFFSATELGRVYDPVMWQVAQPGAAGSPWGDVMTNTLASTDFGGGNTLRIGRPEHPRFAADPGTHAVRLLDLFHAGISRSSDAALREGPLVRIRGHVNLNTATRDALRALVAGPLVMDPAMARRTSENHDTSIRMAPPVAVLDAAARELPAGRIADAIVRARPFATPSDLARVQDTNGEFVFGNRALLSQGTRVNWTDSAAEEAFARVYEASTVRSRNFRVWVIGQSLAPAAGDGSPQVLAEVRKVFTVFADPGDRESDGSIIPGNARLEVNYENDF
jgi:hypothetical protein